MDHLLVLQWCLYVILLSHCSAVCGLFEWMRKTESPPAPAPSASSDESATSALLIKDAQFEMATADEKFLAEAKQMELSPLDSCHQKVVARLKSSCESLSEQQLAKLGVVLFNCQAEIEGRRTYPCLEEMTIKECTASMDPDTWNAYHIVSNRARSVCYATRQMLFRRRAEHTVNALISTATSQLDAMNDLKEGQLELREITAASLNKVLQGHSTLQAQQSHLHEGQRQMESSLRDNMERLGQEKALIASGQELVAQLIEGITQRMENVSEHLQVQSTEVKESHKAIVKDLSDVRHQAQDIHHKIDSSVTEFQQYQDQTSLYYSDLIAKFERMNHTLGFVLYTLDNLQSMLDGRLHVIQSYLDWAGLSLSAMWTCMAHAGYFILGAILLSFLGCPGFSRAVLFLIVPLNAMAEVNQQPALDLCGLSLLLLTLCLGHWFICQLGGLLVVNNAEAAALPLGPCEIVQPEKPKTSSPLLPPTSTPESKQEVLSDKKCMHNQDSFISGELSISVVSPDHKRTLGLHNHSTPRALVTPIFSAAATEHVSLRSCGNVFDADDEFPDFALDTRSASPNPSIISNSSRSGRLLCSGITKAGKACKMKAMPGSEYCRVHEGGRTSYISSI